MNKETADQIRSASDREARRRSHPDGFPSLPLVPARRYTDPDFFELEREHIFGKAWLFAAHVDELREPGDLLAIEHLSVPVLLTRAKDGQVRAFFNTCTHRGTPLVGPGTHHVKRRIACPYHAWAFDLTGELGSVPESRDFKDLDRACLGLRTIRCEQFAGFVFVTFDPEAPPLRTALAPVVAEMDDEVGDGAPGSEFHLIKKCSYEIAGNWKLAVDANLETYHVNQLHKDTASSAIDLRTTTISLYSSGHSRMFLRQRPEIEANLPLERFPHVGDLGSEGVLTYSLFPNIAWVISPQLMFTTNSWPIAHDRTRYELYFIGAAAATEETQPIWDLLLGFNVNVIEEDIDAIQGMHRSLASGAIDGLPLSYQERRIYQTHEEIDRRIGVDRIPPSLRVTPVLDPWIE